jgi:hypothetical protein
LSPNARRHLSIVPCVNITGRPPDFWRVVCPTNPHVITTRTVRAQSKSRANQLVQEFSSCRLTSSVTMPNNAGRPCLLPGCDDRSRGESQPDDLNLWARCYLSGCPSGIKAIRPSKRLTTRRGRDRFGRNLKRGQRFFRCEWIRLARERRMQKRLSPRSSGFMESVGSGGRSDSELSMCGRYRRTTAQA